MTQYSVQNITYDTVLLLQFKHTHKHTQTHLPSVSPCIDFTMSVPFGIFPLHKKDKDENNFDIKNYIKSI